nr:MAG TPA: hypothetical protein [Caudoviricetes sp.]
MPEFATLAIIGFIVYFLAKAVLKAFHGVGGVIITLSLLFIYWVWKTN